MLAVSNTSPLNYLVQLGCVEILEKIYARIARPSIVIEELQHAKTPEIVRQWALSPPTWLEVIQTVSDASLAETGLHAGEIGAISLAESCKADFVILDDRHARSIATSRGLTDIGLLGVLKRAVTMGILDPRTITEQLLQTTFRISPDLAREELLGEAR